MGNKQGNNVYTETVTVSPSNAGSQSWGVPTPNPVFHTWEDMSRLQSLVLQLQQEVLRLQRDIVRICNTKEWLTGDRTIPPDPQE